MPASAGDNKIVSILSYFPNFFGLFESLALLKNGRTNLTLKQSNRIFLVNFSKVQKSNNFLKKPGYLTKR